MSDLFTDNSENKQKIRDWAKGIVSDVKEAFGIHSPSAVMRDEVGKYLALGVSQGLAENDKYVVKQFSAMLEKLNYQRDFDIISESDYYTQLEGLRDRYFAKGSENWVKYTEKIYAYQQKLVENEKKAQEAARKAREAALEAEKKSIAGLYDDIAKYASSRLDEVLKRQQALYKELKNYGSLYNLNKVTINGVTDSYYSLHDLNRDIEAIRRYGELMEQVGERAEKLGVSGEAVSGLMADLRELDITAATGLSSALSIAPDEQFTAYFNAWDTKNKLARKVSAEQYSEDFGLGWEDALGNMKRELEKAGYDIPEGFSVSGGISAEKFGDAFIEGLDEQLQKVRDRIDEFNATLSLDIAAPAGNIYNTTNTSYNISGQQNDAIEQIKRYETLKRLSGVK